MQSQYSGKCKVDANHTWDAGDEIFYQKDPKCICSNKACFEAQKAAGYGNKPKAEPKQTKIDERSSEQKVIDSIQMVELLWCPALEKAKEVYDQFEGTKSVETIYKKDIMILAQVFFKAMVENYNK